MHFISFLFHYMSINPLEIVINYDRDLSSSAKKDLGFHKAAVLAFEKRGHGIVLKSRADEYSNVPRIYLISYNAAKELERDAYLRKEYGALIDAMLEYLKRSPFCNGDSHFKFIVHDGFFLAY